MSEGGFDMSEHDPVSLHVHARCCDGGCDGRHGVSRREFLAASGIAVSAMAITGMTWQAAAAADAARSEERRVGEECI